MKLSETPLESGPVDIGGRIYHVVSEGETDGCKLWPCSIALARVCASLDFRNLTVCDVGCGLGLSGMVAAAQGGKVTFLDNDPLSPPLVVANLLRNGLFGDVRMEGWENTHDRFDSIIGSEVMYRKYDPDALARFISDCWTGKGRVLFVNATYYGIKELFVPAIEARGLKAQGSVLSTVLPNSETLICELWEIV